MKKSGNTITGQQSITKHRTNYIILFILPFILVSVSSTYGHDTNIQSSLNGCVPGREKLLMDFSWRFALGNANDVSKDFNYRTSYFSYWTKAGYGDGPADPDFDDRGWRILNLPHDWAVELPFDSTGGYSHGYKPLGLNFPENSIGWYRKLFYIPESDMGRKISIRFDGIFRNASVFVNGFYVGQEHSGYAGFQYDVSDYLNYGGDNVVSVRVDATMEEGWFYEGAGIYRHAWLIKTNPLHIVQDGIFISSEIENQAATIKIRANLINEYDTLKSFTIHHVIRNAEKIEIASTSKRQLNLRALEENVFYASVMISNVELWSTDSPYLYSVQTTIISNGKVIDSINTSFGIRSLRFDPDEGFFLNGSPVKLKGTNNHQDHAGVGTAIPDALQDYRIKKLKEMGCNAYRCSHTPPTPEMLDACDKLGMLVIDENRLMGTNREHLDLLERLIKRDRNHPSVILWSLGNEEWAIEGNDYGARIARTMQNFAHRLDSTRLYTIAGSGGWGHGISTVVDVMGFNYIFNGDIDRQHTDFPDQPEVGTEETTSRSTRGIYQNDPAQGYLAQTDRTNPTRGIEVGFKFYEQRPFLAGLFYWTGFDYRGEPNPYGWPQVGSQSGIIDQCGFPKDIYYYLQSWWTHEPILHILPHWNRPAVLNQPVNVWVYGNCDEVELFLNGKSLGRKPMPEFSHLEWEVQYQPGELLAKGYSQGKLTATSLQETTGKPETIKLSADHSIMNADDEDVSVITVWAEDSGGRQVPDAQYEITFSIEGVGKILGVGNGNPASHEADRYFEKVERIPIENLKKAFVSDIKKPREASPEFDISGWPNAFPAEGFENRSTQDSSKYVVIRGTFTLQSCDENTIVTLLAKSLCEEESVYINGHLIATGIKRDQPGQTYALDHSLLHPGINVYAVAGKPLLKRNQWEYLNTDPGLVRIINLPDPWKRKLFSGLAQVIVQSEKQAGNIRIVASSPGLKNAEIILETKAIDLRPAIRETYYY